MNNFRFRSTCIANILLLLSLFYVSAAMAQCAVPLTLVDAVQLAVGSRLDMRIEEEKVNIARSQVRENKGNFLPSLDIGGSSTYIKNYDTFTGITISARIADQDVSANLQKEVPQYELNGNVDLLYNLYAGGRDMALLRAVKSEMASAEHQQAITLRKIRFEVSRAYWELKISRMRYLMAKREFDQMRREAEVAQTRYRAARLSQIDYDTVLLQEKEKEAALKIADRTCLQSFREYLRTVDVLEDEAVISSEQVPDLTDSPNLEGDFAVDEAHPELLKVKSDILAKREREQAARSANWPTVDLFAKYALIGRDTSSYSNSWSDLGADQYIAGIKVSMNLFSGMRTKERISQAEAEVRVKRLELEEKKRRLEKETEDKKAELAATKDQLELAIQRERLAGAREKVAASNFRSGRISELDYRQQTLQAKNAIDDTVIARINVVLAEDALRLLVVE